MLASVSVIFCKVQSPGNNVVLAMSTIEFGILSFRYLNFHSFISFHVDQHMVGFATRNVLKKPNAEKIVR